MLTLQTTLNVLRAELNLDPLSVKIIPPVANTLTDTDLLWSFFAFYQL